MAVSREQYQQLLKREFGRAGTNRDDAVRRANIAAGFGNSTAQRFMHESGGKPSGGQKAASGSRSPYALPKKAPRPSARPDMTKTSGIQGMMNRPSDPGEDRATRFRPDAWTSAVGRTPNPYAQGFSPDLAPSPNPYAMGSPVNPNAMPQGPAGGFPPGLAPSPNPYAMGSPVNPHPLAMPQPFNPGMAAAQAMGAAIGQGGRMPGRPPIDIERIFGVLNPAPPRHFFGSD